MKCKECHQFDNDLSPQPTVTFHSLSMDDEVDLTRESKENESSTSSLSERVSRDANTFEQSRGSEQTVRPPRITSTTETFIPNSSQFRFASTDTNINISVEELRSVSLTVEDHFQEGSSPLINSSTTGSHQQFAGSITSAPTLLPKTPISSRAKSARFAPGTETAQACEESRRFDRLCEDETQVSGWQQTSSVSDQRTTITGDESFSFSTDESLSRTMGHATSNFPLGCTGTSSVLSVSDSASEKLDHSTQQTVMSYDQTNNDDNTTIRSLEAYSLENSPASTPLRGQNFVEPHPLPPHAFVGTPSTVSTAASTDEASIGMDSYTTDRTRLQHRRVPSWESSPHRFAESDPDQFPPIYPLPSQYAPTHSVWNNLHHASRVANLREHEESRFGYPPIAPPDHRWHPSHQQHPRYGDPQLPYLPARNSNQTYRQSPQQPQFYPQTQHPLQPQRIRGGVHYQQSPLPPSTPPRGGPRGARPAGQGSVMSSPHRPSPGPSTPSSSVVSAASSSTRSSSEVLKTLLRKKACLYEVDTSYAIALITWCVGRVLGLEYGFFSRQQLQACVHACALSKIDAGTITRTKVNRCMQIILNSCFHYIIPRPDGTEEIGDMFKNVFAAEVEDDTAMIKLLPTPWSDLVVDRACILEASEEECEKKGVKKSLGTTTSAELTTPQTSPRLSSQPSPVSPGNTSQDEDGSLGKRAVLLCFNENVRCAEDVIRCHNEFIRDTAHASNLQLSAEEWHQFFGSEVTSEAWGVTGISSPHPEIRENAGGDALGVMTRKENRRFRTTWCAKRYDHSAEFCGFAHVEVNGGWLRRNPAIHTYKDEMCSSITTVTDSRIGQQLFVINDCPRGVECAFAHSTEEILYHPKRYKTRNCENLARLGGCPLGDVCHDFHPIELYRFPKKPDRSATNRHSRSSQQGSGNKGVVTPPSGAPLMYASPAPFSSFEKHLFMPGLQNLFRRQCSVVRAHLHNPKCACCYSHFGDDTGLNVDLSLGRSSSSRGLPQPIRA